MNQKITTLETPVLLLDKAAMEHNLRAMDDLLDGSPMVLCPHYKSHKCPELSKLQLRHGAEGITCAKLSEAWDLMEAGIEPIILANQVVQPEKLPKLADLAGKCRLTVCVDHAENVLALEQAMSQAGGHLKVMVEYEVGMRRCGVASDQEFLELAQLIERQPHLSFEGIQAYAGHLSHEEDSEKRHQRMQAIEADVARLKAFLVQSGMPVNQVCGGSTGTADDKPKNTAYTQLQAGSYLLMDDSYQKLNLRFEQALFILSTVVSAKSDRFVVDCGVKSISMDQYPPVFPDYPGAPLTFSEEHLTVFAPNHGLKPGDKVRIIPGHCCTTVNCFTEIYLTEGDNVTAVWPVVSRGKAQ